MPRSPAPRDELQPGRHPRRRLRPPAQQQLQQGPAARRRERRPGRDHQGRRAPCSPRPASVQPTPTSTRPIRSPGAFGSHIVSPNNDGFYLFGQNMASDGTYTYYNDGYGGTGTIYKLDSTGAVVASTVAPNGFNYTGLAYLDGKLYAVAPFDSSIVRLRCRRPWRSWARSPTGSPTRRSSAWPATRTAASSGPWARPAVPPACSTRSTRRPATSSRKAATTTRASTSKTSPMPTAS